MAPENFRRHKFCLSGSLGHCPVYRFRCCNVEPHGSFPGAWLPVESMIYDRQGEYFAAINASNVQGESTEFIRFMLSVIKASLMEATVMRDEMRDGGTDKQSLRWRKIEKYLDDHPYIMNKNVQALCQVSPATANRILSGLTARGKLVKYREAGHWAYRI